MKLAVSAAVLVVVLASVWLGSWQWDRYEAKAERKDRVEQHYSADPVPVTEVLTSEPVPLAREWTRVEARGEYLPDDLLVRNRPRDGVYGYEVLRRLALEDGSVLVVDRGWVPNSPQGATVRPDVPTPPSGSVTVTGWVKLGEPSLDRDPIEGQLSSINLQEAAAEWGGTSLLGGYVVRQSETPVAAQTPADLDRPDVGIGPHLAYAIQWWLVPPAVVGFVWAAARREKRERLASAPAHDRSGAEPFTPRPKKVRVWDEEDG
ncbi:SURF1 family cytochrome oxidase biogenesis protein [Janibacter endophyticus]|uniref:SURF1 family cytochrome oxidase biogenesis protein n=1 Tax=Janibacter endophyticus TaxID=2806261 RepID=UPI001F2C4569|nr:SURF1 family protein [Janibacter endophyticus]